MKLILEGRDAPLYHTTSFKNLMSILDSNTLKVGRTFANGRKPAVCFSRSIEFASSYGGNVIIEFDQQKLASKYKIVPVADTINLYKPKVGRYVGSSKAEEDIMSDITNVKNYITRIFVLKACTEDEKEELDNHMLEIKYMR